MPSRAAKRSMRIEGVNLSHRRLGPRRQGQCRTTPRKKRRPGTALRTSAQKAGCRATRAPGGQPVRKKGVHESNRMRAYRRNLPGTAAAHPSMESHRQQVRRPRRSEEAEERIENGICTRVREGRKKETQILGKKEEAHLRHPGALETAHRGGACTQCTSRRNERPAGQDRAGRIILSLRAISCGRRISAERLVRRAGTVRVHNGDAPDASADWAPVHTKHIKRRSI